MLENLRNFFKKIGKKEEEDLLPSSSDAAKERLHLVLMQDRVNVSVDFLDMMKLEILEVIKKYIDIDEKEMDVRLTNLVNEDGSNGAPALYANIPIVGIKADKKNYIEPSEASKNEVKISNNVKKDEEKKNTKNVTKNNSALEDKNRKKDSTLQEKNTKKDSSAVEKKSANNSNAGEQKNLKKAVEKKEDKTGKVEENNKEKEQI